MTRGWIPIKARNDGHGPPDDRTKNVFGRVYGLHGKKYPRLSLSVYMYPQFDGDPFEGCSVAASIQKRHGAQWISTPYYTVPFELVEDLIELLKLAREKVVVEK